MTILFKHNGVRSDHPTEEQKDIEQEYKAKVLDAIKPIQSDFDDNPQGSIVIDFKNESKANLQIEGVDGGMQLILLTILNEVMG